MRKVAWFVLWFAVGFVAASFCGCAHNRLTLGVNSVYYIDGQPVDFQARYEVVK